MERRTKSGLVAMLALVLAGGAACNLLDPDTLDGERERLAAAREQWSSQGITSYDYVLRRLCFCGGGTEPANVTVRNGVKVSVTVVATGEPVPVLFVDAYLTVPELFDFIEDAIDRDAHSIEVEYDGAYGYPVSIRIDYLENAIDEEMAFEASALRPLR